MVQRMGYLGRKDDIEEKLKGKEKKKKVKDSGADSRTFSCSELGRLCLLRNFLQKAKGCRGSNRETPIPYHTPTFDRQGWVWGVAHQKPAGPASVRKSQAPEKDLPQRQPCE